METGKVKFFSMEKGWGFISPDSGEKDIFLHVTEVQKAGVESVKEGQLLRFDVKEKDNGKKAAINIELTA